MYQDPYSTTTTGNNGTRTVNHALLGEPELRRDLGVGEAFAEKHVRQPQAFRKAAEHCSNGLSHTLLVLRRGEGRALRTGGHGEQ